MPQTDRRPSPQPTTVRGQAKARRRQDLLAASATLFAERGFAGVSIDDIGAAAGVSGPAVYRHFASKQAVLGAVLLEVSHDLLERGREVARHAPDPQRRLRDLVRFQVDFALHRPAVIVVQDRELPNLTAEDRRAVRVLQRGYVTLWVEALRELAPAREVADLTLRAQAAFGLINSTPHSLRAAQRLRTPQEAERLDAARAALEEMAWAALRTAIRPDPTDHPDAAGHPVPTSTGGTP
ncbi:TetR/AcrR family transcriptional regulator [Kocuria sp. SM24M-10]|uniref:TetR/AcrR family transcriptional regulator n=1 Tax=Kocuria sp. SM24M-10 TaxID=1660349 RepID=UPI000649E1B8|nr:TetR/AcrR family transcriptional regulator [Kocuria sp. SM24M-10]KLU09379.1 TetR family transcriptional regulator [Kocuria sp. SM24M-10]